MMLDSLAVRGDALICGRRCYDIFSLEVWTLAVSEPKQDMEGEGEHHRPSFKALSVMMKVLEMIPIFT